MMDFVIDGVRTVKSCRTTSKKEAKHLEVLERQKVLSDSKLSPEQKSSKLSLHQAIEEVYDVRWKLNKDSKGTLQRATRLADLMGNPRLGLVSETTVQQLIRTLEKLKLETATVNRYLTCLKTILKHYRLDHHFITLRKERNGRIRTISKEEMSKLLKLLRSNNFSIRQSHYSDCADLFESLLDTGCRLSELLNVTYQDIDFEANHIRIWVNKGDRPRSIPMTRRVRVILEAKRQDNSDKPFAMDKYQAERTWTYARRHMGLENEPGFCIHMLRHSAASRLLSAGIDLYTVKELLGHASIIQTQRYAHLDPNKLVEAIRKFD